jgi:DNA-binding transcriptional LysR family regulator
LRKEEHTQEMQGDDLNWLLLVYRAGSLSAAAKQRNVAVSTAARRIAALEGALGLRLLDRRANGSKLTADGQRIAMLAEPVVEGSARIARAAAAMRDTEGREEIRISATEFVVSDILAPALHHLYQAHPTFTIVLQAQGEVVSLAARNADIAVRMSRPEGNSLIAKKLPALRLGLYGASACLSGRVITPNTLNKERLLVYDDSYGRLPEMDWISKWGLEGSIGLRTGSTRALITAAAGGAGIALLPAIHAKAAGLVELDIDLDLPARTPWVVVHEDLRKKPAIRAVHAWIESAFKDLKLE